MALLKPLSPKPQPEQDDDKDADGEYEEINNEDVINGTSEEGVEEVQGATKA